MFGVASICCGTMVIPSMWRERHCLLCSLKCSFRLSATFDLFLRLAVDTIASKYADKKPELVVVVATLSGLYPAAYAAPPDGYTLRGTHTKVTLTSWSAKLYNSSLSSACHFWKKKKRAKQIQRTGKERERERKTWLHIN